MHPIPPHRHIYTIANPTLLPGTSGIGRAAVLALASHNPLHIYFTGRDDLAGEKLVDEVGAKHQCQVTFIKCDLSSPRELIRLAISDNFHSPRLDVFIANAGIMAVPPGLTAEGFEIQFGTNYLGHAVLLRLLRPVMLRTAALPASDVRMVVLSSFGHTMAPPGGIEFDRLRAVETPEHRKHVAEAGTKWQRYGQSKLADILLARAMAKRYPQVTSVSVHPGLVNTNLGAAAESSLLTYLLMSLRWTPLYKSAEEGAYNTLWAATTPKEELENGGYYEPVGKAAGKQKSVSGMADICKDEALADRLWEWTENELAGLKELQGE